MIKPENVPDAVWHTAMSTYHKAIKKRPGSAWQEAIAAAINAWPGMLTERRARCDAVVLPYNLDADLPQEASDAEAR